LILELKATYFLRTRALAVRGIP